MTVITWHKNPTKEEICSKDNPWNKSKGAMCHPSSTWWGKQADEDGDLADAFKCDICGTEFFDNFDTISRVEVAEIKKL